MSLNNYLRSLLELLRSDKAVSQLPVGSIQLQGVNKRFRKRTATRSSYTSVKSELLSGSDVVAGERPAKKGNYLHALKDTSIDLEPGCALGVIGRNGSGKSTLLKLISGIYLPDSGTVQTSGRISALIELGAGFHPDFSGRENIYLGGVMYGLTKTEIHKKFDDIVSYAELEDFIDDPVRTYSSGMYMRLGFSLAVHTDPDILLIDEVLAVGDAGFIHKCQDTISEFKRRGKTLIFVTHDLHSVNRWCDEVIWLDSGVVRDRGEPRRIIDAYLQMVEEGENKDLQKENDEREGSQRWGNRKVELSDIRLYDGKGTESWLFQPEDEVTIEVHYRINEPIDDLEFGIGVIRADGLQVHGTNTDLDDVVTPVPDSSQIEAYPVSGVYRYKIVRLGLTEDSYFLDIAAHSSDGLPYDYHHRLYKFSVRSSSQPVGVYTPEHDWQFEAQYEVLPSERTEKRVVGE